MRKKPEPEEPLLVMGLYITESLKQYKRPRSVVGKQVPNNIISQIINVIRQYQDVFAYTVDEMPGIDPRVMVHRLNITKDIDRSNKSCDTRVSKESRQAPKR